MLRVKNSINVKKDLEPQVWYEEAENGYQVCIRRLHKDYFRTDFIKCHNKVEAMQLVQEIKDNGYTNITKRDLIEPEDEYTEPESYNFSFEGSTFISKEEKPRANFEFDNEGTLESQYKHIPRYTEIPEEEIQETGVNKPKKFGDVQIGKGIL